MSHKLKVFKEVVLTKSFSKAAIQLHMSQPAISKSIKNLEEFYKKSFFKRLGRKIELTTDGRTFLKYANRILSIYKEAEDYFRSIDNNLPEQIQFGASSTLAQYTIPVFLSKIHEKFPNKSFSVINGNTQQIEDLILNEYIDFGIVEGATNNNLLQYSDYLEDEIVLVTSSKNEKSGDYNPIKVEDLTNLPFVLRESGSGTKDIIENTLKNYNIEFKNIIASLGSTEGIKQYISNTESMSCFAFMSIYSIRNELEYNKLRIIKIQDLRINRYFHFVSRQGYQSNTFIFFKNLFQSSIFSENS